MNLNDKQLEYLKNAPNFEANLQQKLQDADFQKQWLELSLQEFLNDGNIDYFVQTLTKVVKSRGRGEIKRLAEVSDIDRGNLSEILNGKITPRIDTAIKLIRGLGYECDIKLKSA